MILESLTFRGWRNLENAEISLAPGLTIIFGKNAQGKTNLLEAVFTLVTGRSHRALRDDELITFGLGETFVSGSFSRPSGHTVYTLHLAPPRRKERKRDAKTYRSGEDPLGDPRVILFSPDDLQLVQGSPALRRRFLDQDLGQISPGYGALLKDYARALSQRNGVLRSGRQELLPAFNAVWAPLAVKLTKARSLLLRDLAPVASENHARIAPGDLPLTIAYLPSLQAETPEEAIFEIRRHRDEETARRTTVLGPHRDDIRMRMGENELRAFGSQGQQRTAAVSMKVAAVDFIRKREGLSPLLLLDDVLSELDQARREALAEVVRQGQTLLTTADDGTLPRGLRGDRTYVVEKGRIAEGGAL